MRWNQQNSLFHWQLMDHKLMLVRLRCEGPASGIWAFHLQDGVVLRRSRKPLEVPPQVKEIRPAALGHITEKPIHWSTQGIRRLMLHTFNVTFNRSGSTHQSSAWLSTQEQHWPDHTHQGERDGNHGQMIERHCEEAARYRAEWQRGGAGEQTWPKYRSVGPCGRGEKTAGKGDTGLTDSPQNPRVPLGKTQSSRRRICSIERRESPQKKEAAQSGSDTLFFSIRESGIERLREQRIPSTYTGYTGKGRTREVVNVRFGVKATWERKKMRIPSPSRSPARVDVATELQSGRLMRAAAAPNGTSERVAWILDSSQWLVIGGKIERFEVAHSSDEAVTNTALLALFNVGFVAEVYILPEEEGSGTSKSIRRWSAKKGQMQCMQRGKQSLGSTRVYNGSAVLRRSQRWREDYRSPRSWWWFEENEGMRCGAGRYNFWSASAGTAPFGQNFPGMSPEKLSNRNTQISMLESAGDGKSYRSRDEPSLLSGSPARNVKLRIDGAAYESERTHPLSTGAGTSTR
ncbi:hypothetical protein B0H16DRAFT_1474479 [Mycena metata]|uniref:Uncharacterized protein n=1 Tax=Mycena metata TaxID=1033252 RepID=A0AAD7HGG6_9AGAR|nr:hypothetical protein B0H16DRAFT_1474479 [Mycena metata]